MPRAVRFSRYGGPEVLEVAQVLRPQAGPGEVLGRVVVAPVNPGEAGISLALPLRDAPQDRRPRSGFFRPRARRL
jgi:NADPH:quinone reductase-like Zn-dependent oxidoreductase